MWLHDDLVAEGGEAPFERPKKWPQLERLGPIANSILSKTLFGNLRKNMVASPGDMCLALVTEPFDPGGLLYSSASPAPFSALPTLPYQQLQRTSNLPLLPTLLSTSTVPTITSTSTY